MFYHNISSQKQALQAQVGITAHIVLGSPKKKCDGIGICRIERAVYQSGALAIGSCRFTKALLTIHAGQLSIYFVKHTLSLCALQKHFKNERFIIEEAVEVPVNVAHGLKLFYPVVIMPGNYQVQALKNHLVVSVAINNDLPFYS